jgi:hypothetical protein
MKLHLSRQIFEKYSNIEFQENPPNGSRVVPSEWADGQTDRRTDMTKLIVFLRNFANAPNVSTIRPQNTLTCSVRIFGTNSNCITMQHRLTYFHN